VRVRLQRKGTVEVGIAATALALVQPWYEVVCGCTEGGTFFCAHPTLHWISVVFLAFQRMSPNCL